MALVESARDAFTADRLTVEATSARSARPGEPFLLWLTVRDPAGRPITDFAPVHEKPMHLFVVHEDLGDMFHFHPIPDARGGFSIGLRLPRPGRWQLIADFVPRGGMPQLLQGAVFTAGYQAPLAVAHLPDQEELADNGIALAPAERIAGVPSEIVARAPGPIRPWMGALAHLLVVSEDLQDVVHAHAERDGEKLRFPVTLPRPGRYRVWLQLDRDGKLVTARFTVRARAREAPFLAPATAPR
jgi:hypothetical protein